MKNRAPANTVNGNAIKASADGPREEAEGIGLYRGISKPAHVDAEAARLSHWKQCYGSLWQLKLSYEAQSLSRWGDQEGSHDH